MTSRRALVLGIAALAVAGFGGAAWVWKSSQKPASVAAPAPPADSSLVRAYSPVLGPADAPVTIVEFLDPACEACRAFYPVVKQIMGMFPGKVRVVVRYAALHNGSDEAVRILETARMQGVFELVLEALFREQPSWASHNAPSLDTAWEIAGRAGLNLEQARRDRLAPHITATLNQDRADLGAAGVRQTPTFFVNGKPLLQFGPQQLLDLVQSEVNAL